MLLQVHLLHATQECTIFSCEQINNYDDDKNSRDKLVSVDFCSHGNICNAVQRAWNHSIWCMLSIRTVSVVFPSQTQKVTRLDYRPLSQKNELI